MATTRRPPPHAPCTDGIPEPDAAWWPTTHGRVWYAAARTKPSARAAVGACAPREVPLRATRGGTAGAGPAREDGPSPRAASQCASNRVKPETTLFGSSAIAISTELRAARLQIVACATRVYRFLGVSEFIIYNCERALGRVYPCAGLSEGPRGSGTSPILSLHGWVTSHTT